MLLMILSCHLCQQCDIGAYVDNGAESVTVMQNST